MSDKSRFPTFLSKDESAQLQQRIAEMASAALDQQFGMLIGAGFSFDARELPTGTQLAAALAQDIGNDEGAAKKLAEIYGLAAIAEQYEQQTTGKRKQLMEALSRRLTAKGATSQAEEDLAAIISNCGLTRVFTTNYDSLIESALGRSRCVVLKQTAKDLAEFDREVRRKEFTAILHIHGTTESPVITETDLHESRNIFFEELRHELLSKVFVMIGYSFRDESISSILENIYDLLRQTREERKTYLVSPIEQEFEYRFAREYWKDRSDISLIPMTAGAFLAELLEQIHSVGSLKAINEISEKIRQSTAEVKAQLAKFHAGLSDLGEDDVAEFARRMVAVRMS